MLMFVQRSAAVISVDENRNVVSSRHSSQQEVPSKQSIKSEAIERGVIGEIDRSSVEKT